MTNRTEMLSSTVNLQRFPFQFDAINSCLYWGVRSVLTLSGFINTTIDPLLSSGGKMTQLSVFYTSHSQALLA